MIIVAIIAIAISLGLLGGIIIGSGWPSKKMDARAKGYSIFFLSILIVATAYCSAPYFQIVIVILFAAILILIFISAAMRKLFFKEKEKEAAQDPA